MTIKESASLRALASIGLVGAVSVSAVSAAHATEDFTFDRIAGSDRYVTSALVAEAYAGGDTAILVNGQSGNYADALSANYLSGVLDAPILLTRATSTPAVIVAQLAAADVSKVIVVGGDGMVSEGQVEELEKAGFEVERVSGKNRYATSAAVIAEGEEAVEGVGLIATGQGFADALAGGPLAYQGHPMALTRKDSIDADVVDALKSAGVDSVYVLGGEGVIADSVLEQLEEEEITVLERLSGKNRSATSVAIADKVISDHGFAADAVNVASGADALFGADALSGGPLTGVMGRALLVTNDADNPAFVTSFLEDNCATLAEGLIFGGEVAVSLTAEAQMEAAGQSCDDSEDPGDPEDPVDPETPDES